MTTEPDGVEMRHARYAAASIPDEYGANKGWP